MNKKSFFFVSIVALVSNLWLSCSENQNPVLGRSGPDTISVNSFEFFPKRKFVTSGDSVDVYVLNYQRGFVCSEMTSLNVEEHQPGEYSPVIVVEHPQSITKCATVGVLGEDTLISTVFNLNSSTEEYVILTNSSLVPTDTAVLTQKPHHLVFQDTLLLLDSSATNKDSVLNDWLGSLTLPCGNSLSYGNFCWSNQSDSLHLWLWATSGWDSTQCVSALSEGLKYYREILTDPVLGCVLTPQ